MYCDPLAQLVTSLEGYVRDSKAGTAADNPALTDAQVVTWLRLLARFMPVIMEEGSDDFYQSLFWASPEPRLLGEQLMDVYVELLFLVRWCARSARSWTTRLDASP